MIDIIPATDRDREHRPRTLNECKRHPVINELSGVNNRKEGLLI